MKKRRVAVFEKSSEKWKGLGICGNESKLYIKCNCSSL